MGLATYEGEQLDTWHWAAGVLIGIGFVPGLGDAIKQTGNAVIDGLRTSDSASIQSAIKIIRSISDGNVVKYLSNFHTTLKSYGKKSVKLINKIIDGLQQAIKNISANGNWIVRLMKDAFQGLINAMKTLVKKIDQMVIWIAKKVDEFIDKVVTRVTGFPKKKGSAIKSDNINAGIQEASSGQSGQYNTAAKRAEEEAPTGIPTGKGEPVDMSTGKVFEQRQDFALPGLIALEHQRYYQSAGQNQTGLMGTLWRSSWDISLSIEDGIATFTDTDYSQGVFPLPTHGAPTRSALKPQWRLHRHADELLLKHKDGRRYHFGHAVGQQVRLSKISDNHDNSISFLYERGTLKWVELSDNQLIQVHTNHRRITALELLDEQKRAIQILARYRYDKHGRLLSVRASEGRNFDYQYSEKGYLIRWEDLASTWVEHDYDDQGRATATRCAGDYWHDQIRYDDDNRILAIIDPNGNRTEQEWYLDNLISTTDLLGLTTQYQYDDWGNVTQVTLPDGTLHHYQYDDHGQLHCQSLGVVKQHFYLEKHGL